MTTPTTTTNRQFPKFRKWILYSRCGGPFLIVVFAQTYGLAPNGHKVKNYYVSESVGIATGMLISALHLAGLVALTHTPSPMGFLNRILERPAREKPFLILVVGHPAEDASVPDISKKTLQQIVTSF